MSYNYFETRKAEAVRNLCKQTISSMEWEIKFINSTEADKIFTQEQKDELTLIYTKEIEDRLKKDIPKSFIGKYKPSFTKDTELKECFITVLDVFTHHYTGVEIYHVRMEYPSGYMEYKTIDKRKELVDYFVFGERF